MPINGTVQATGEFAPSSTGDTYAILDAKYIRGGLQNVDLLSDLDLITTDRRFSGMIVGVSGGTAYYKLAPEPWSYTSTDWSVFGGGSQNLAQVLTNGNSVSGQTITSTNGNYYLSLTDSVTYLGNTGNTNSIKLDDNSVVPYILRTVSPTTDVYLRQEMLDYGFFQGFGTVVGYSSNSDLYAQWTIRPFDLQFVVNNAVVLSSDLNNTNVNNKLTANRLAITNLGTGTSITNLGIDSSGNVVSGSTGGSTSKYIESTGLTANSAYTVTHNLGSEDVIVQVKDMTSNAKITVTIDNYQTNSVYHLRMGNQHHCYLQIQNNLYLVSPSTLYHRLDMFRHN
jgi:hypothetical protein